MESLLAAAEQDPDGTEKEVHRLLASADHPRMVALGKRCLGLIARSRGDLSAAIELFRSSIDLARANELDDLESESRLVLATSLASVGNLNDSLQELSLAYEHLAPRLHAEAKNCEGFALLNLERIPEAREAFRQAEVHARENDQTADLAKILNNRSVLLIQAGEMSQAQADLEEAVRCFKVLSAPLNAAKAEHNLGWLFARQGLVVEALTAYRRADLQGGPELSAICVGALDRAELYLNARLLHEASHALVHAQRLAEVESLERQFPEISLLRGRVLSCLGDFGAAADAFAAAESEFEAQQRAHGAEVAAFCRHLVSSDASPTTHIALPDSSEQVERYRSDIVDVACARLLSLRNDRNEPHRRELVGSLIEVLAWGADSPNAITRTQSAMAGAVRALEAHDEHAMAEGVDEILLESERHLNLVNSAELRSIFIEVLELEALICDVAAALGDPDQFRGWTERLRQCVAGRFSVAQENTKRRGELSGQTDTFRRDQLSPAETSNVSELSKSTRRRRVAEFAIRTSEWVDVGATPEHLHPGWGTPVVHDLSGAPDRSELDSSILLEFAASSTTLVVSVRRPSIGVAESRSSLIELCPINEVRGRIHSVRIASASLFDGASVSNASAETDWRIQRFERAIQRLESLILPPRLPEGPLVIVPNGLLGSVPWHLFEKLRGRTITVSPCKGDWQPFQPTRLRRTPVGIVAGPGLSYANDELDALHELYDDAIILKGSNATVTAVCQLMNEVDTLHVAAHGIRRTDSALFSGIELYDGALVAYDLLRIPRTPATVLLSCCDLGAANAAGACGLLGFTSTLRSRGSSQVAAAVLPIDDRSSQLAMTRLHRVLRQVPRLAEALTASVAAAETPLDRITTGSFVVVGGPPDAPLDHRLVS